VLGRLDIRTIDTRTLYAGGLEFESRTGQTLHSVTNGLPPLRIYASTCVAFALWRGDGHRKLVTRFSVIRRVSWKVWFFGLGLLGTCSFISQDTSTRRQRSDLFGLGVKLAYCFATS